MTPAPEAGLDGMDRAPGTGHAPSRRTGTAMAAEAATFALASAAHFATGFTDAAIPELIIAAVLGLGSSATLSQRQHARGTAVGATSFATFGTIVGLTIIAAGRQDAPDLAYHTTILAALAATLITLWRQRDAARLRQRMGPSAHRPASAGVAAGNPKTAMLQGGSGSAQHTLRAGYSAQIDDAAR